ncbi:MAG: DUF563 domain-containing protein [Magnetococcales bacterium]|nr:DUF563 domain-containing protein [Magnetococcales bacterium]
MHELLETLFHLDARDDVQGMLDHLRDHTPADLNAVLFIIFQFLTGLRIRPAYILAMMMANNGHRHSLISLALAIGGSAFDNPGERSRGLAELREQMNTLPEEQRITLYRRVVAPALSQLLTQAEQANQFDRLPAILEILAVAFGAFAALSDPTPPLAGLTGKGEAAGRIPEQAARMLSGAAGDPPRGVRRVVVVERSGFFSALPWPRPLEQLREFILSRPAWHLPPDLGRRLYDALRGYGWQTEYAVVSGADPEQDRLEILDVCRRQDAQLLLLDQAMLYTAASDDHPALPCVGWLQRLRRTLPGMRIVGVLHDPLAIEPAVLREAAALLDLLWNAGSCAWPLWSEPGLADKVIHMPLPVGFAPDLSAHPLQSWPQVAGRQDELAGFFLRAARGLDHPLHSRAMESGLPSVCRVHLALNLFSPSPVTDLDFAILRQGGLLIRYRSEELREFFTPGEHYLEFSTLGELGELTRFLATRAPEVEAVRQRGLAWARECYGNETLIARLERELAAIEDRPAPGISPMPPEIVPFAFISVHRWCRRVPAGELLGAEDHAIACFPELAAPQPPLDLEGVRARGIGLEELFPWDEVTFGAMVPNFDFRTRRVMLLHEPLFVARLRDACVEFPGFNILPERHLVLEESHHHKSGTRYAIGRWYGKYNALRSQRFTAEVDMDEGVLPLSMEVPFRIHREPDQEIDEAAILLSSSAPHNYYHWMIEMLPRLWCLSVMPELNALPIILRPPLEPFQVQTLTALGISPERIRWFHGRTLRVRELIFPSFIAPGSISSRHIEWLRSRLLPTLGIELRPPRELIYISRAKTGSRRLLNEPSLLPALQERGFRTLFLEEMPLEEQLQAFSDARLVVMPHGSAGTNMIFAQPGATLIELLSRTHPHPMCLQFCSLNGCSYGSLLCDDSGSPHKADLIVEIPALLRVIDGWLQQEAEGS